MSSKAFLEIFRNAANAQGSLPQMAAPKRNIGLYAPLMSGHPDGVRQGGLK